MGTQPATYPGSGEAQGPGSCTQGFCFKARCFAHLTRSGVKFPMNVKKMDIFLTGQLRALKCCLKMSWISEMQDERKSRDVFKRYLSESTT